MGIFKSAAILCFLAAALLYAVVPAPLFARQVQLLHFDKIAAGPTKPDLPAVSQVTDDFDPPPQSLVSPHELDIGTNRADPLRSIAASLRANFAHAVIPRSSVTTDLRPIPNRYTSCTSERYMPAAFLPPSVEARRRLLYPLVKQSACRNNIPVDLLDALIIQESSYDVSARSHVGAFGLTQLMSATAQSLGANRYSIASNLEGGARYLKEQINRFGAPHLALAAYNAGPSRVAIRWSVPAIRETRNYVARVMRYWQQLSASAKQAVPVEFADTIQAPALLAPAFQERAKYEPLQKNRRINFQAF